MTSGRRLGRIGIVAVVAVSCAIGGSAVGYAASKSKPLSSVCVAKKGSHALSAPGKHGCRKGTSRRPLSSAVKGAKGSRGDRGTPGTPGATTVVKPATTHSLPNGSVSSNISQCPAGTTLIGGGYDLSSASAGVQVFRNTSVDDNGAPYWDVAVYNGSGQSVTLTVTAICAQP